MLVIINKFVFAKRRFVHSVAKCAYRTRADALDFDRLVVLVFKLASEVNLCEVILLVLFLGDFIIL